jgi:hypothetical protein
VKLLVQNLKERQTDYGQWVHVIGYITSIDHYSTGTSEGNMFKTIGLQALVLWNAEDLDIASYESALAAEKD